MVVYGRVTVLMIMVTPRPAALSYRGHGTYHVHVAAADMIYISFFYIDRALAAAPRGIVHA